MASNIKEILHYPNPALRHKCKPLERVSAKHRACFDALLATLNASGGIGLAAPQVGMKEKLVVVSGSINSTSSNKEPIFMANPTITKTSSETITGDEGCLSIPNLEVSVTRHSDIKVDYLDYEGKPKTISADSILAVCIQHEIDHLNGVLIVDKIPPAKRQKVLTKWLKENG